MARFEARCMVVLSIVAFFASTGCFVNCLAASPMQQEQSSCHQKEQAPAPEDRSGGTCAERAGHLFEVQRVASAGQPEITAFDASIAPDDPAPGLTAFTACVEAHSPPDFAVPLIHTTVLRV